ncbi:MAG: hypothetical protein KAT68_16065 [Bacteroidales bacterium]|nr:hypothetical protein [Bacteroidales bacterium]
MNRLQSPKKEPIKLTFTFSIPRLNLYSISFWDWSIPLFIILIIFLFNFPYLFIDFLVDDDGLWYYFASSGEEIYKYTWRGNPWRDWFYSYSMVYMGLPFIRGIYLANMALISLLLYYLYRNIFGINTKIAIAAAVIPNILPSLIGIPVGLNLSYAMWGLMPITASLLVLSKALLKKIGSSWFLFIVALALYAFGLNMSSTATSLIPSVLFFFLFYFPKAKIRTIVYGVPFLAYGIWQFFQHIQSPKLDSQTITNDVIIDRSQQFFEMSSFLPYNQSYSLYITIGLAVLGIIGLISMNPIIYKQPIHFNSNKNYFLLLMIGWPLCWTFFTSYAYLTAATTFHPFRYAYIFNFGPVFLQVIGVVFVVFTIRKYLYLTKHTKLTIALLSFGLIIFTGIQRLNNCSYYNTEPSQIIRSTLSTFDLPKNTQIIIIDNPRNWYIPHSGNHKVNSGFIRYLLQRNDLYAIIGKDIYPNDVFRRYGQFWWFDHMVNFDSQKPIIAFRYKDNNLERVELMLQVKSARNEGSSCLNWSLFDISSIQVPVKIAKGVGMSSYTDYINNNLPQVFHNADIAFAPNDFPDDFANADVAEKLAQKKGLIDKKINIGEYFTLRNIVPFEKNNKIYLQILLRVIEIPKTHFKLSYTIDKKKNLVSLWDIAMKDDNILIITPPINLNNLKKGISLGFVNTGVWPYKPLLIKDGDFTKESNIIIQSDYSNSINK